MQQARIPDLVWRKSSHSGSGPDSNCLEVAAALPGVVLIRDSKLATAQDCSTLAISRFEWSSLLARLHQDLTGKGGATKKFFQLLSNSIQKGETVRYLR